MQTSIRDIVFIALFAAIIAALGLIPKIDVGIGVPITAQSLGVMLAGSILGAYRGFLA
ncbi:MAG: ECF transporter S component, partial [Hyphomicrobiales bacterium]|nr:ECF transporter S component [Hyphomicrobiales bacterium]